MAHIVLSQRVVHASNYKDVLYARYHFPKRYFRQIHAGDQFVYYQGDRHNRHNRYYFGFGVVGEIYPDPTQAGHYFAELVEARALPRQVPIYDPNEGFFENHGFDEVRQKPNPPWQSSIRMLSGPAFRNILEAAQAAAVVDRLDVVSALEAETDWLQLLQRLNQDYIDAAPAKRQAVVERYIDRGSAVTRLLKQILGANCQICGSPGFLTRSGKLYVEAHHVLEVSKQLPGSLCSENVILVCPGCHKKLHHAPFTCESNATTITIVLFEHTAVIFRNTYTYLNARQEATIAVG